MDHPKFKERILASIKGLKQAVPAYNASKIIHAGLGLYGKRYPKNLSRDMGFPKMLYVRQARGSDKLAHMRSLIRVFASGLNIL